MSLTLLERLCIEPVQHLITKLNKHVSQSAEEREWKHKFSVKCGQNCDVDSNDKFEMKTMQC